VGNYAGFGTGPEEVHRRVDLNTNPTSQPIKQFHIEAQSGLAFTIKQGQIMRVIDVAGEQVSDMICFSAGNVDESLSAGHTIDYNEKIFFSMGDVLYSNRSNPMLTIVADRVGRHVLLYAPCSQEMFARSYGETRAHPNCFDNLAFNLEEFGILASQISIPLNIFMNIDISNEGKIDILPPASKAGDHIDLRAEMDLIVGVTACAAGQCNNYHCTSIEVDIYA
jgi:uncharacterized protein YcgI (DUF1989 family)